MTSITKKPEKKASDPKKPVKEAPEQKKTNAGKTATSASRSPKK